MKTAFVKISSICENIAVICMYFERLTIVKNRSTPEVSCRNKALIIKLPDENPFLITVQRQFSENSMYGLRPFL